MSLNNLKPSVKLTIENPDAEIKSVFGPGIAALCKGVRDTGSLNAAAKSMGMAYSKAWRIIKETEEALNMQLLLRDGAHGSTLTDDGDKLLDAFESLHAEMQKASEEAFKRIIK